MIDQSEAVHFIIKKHRRRKHWSFWRCMRVILCKILVQTPNPFSTIVLEEKLLFITVDKENLY
jgi:hypothetical protein